MLYAFSNVTSIAGSIALMYITDLQSVDAEKPTWLPSGASTSASVNGVITVVRMLGADVVIAFRPRTRTVTPSTGPANSPKCAIAVTSVSSAGIRKSSSSTEL